MYVQYRFYIYTGQAQINSVDRSWFHSFLLDQVPANVWTWLYSLLQYKVSGTVRILDCFLLKDEALGREQILNLFSSPRWSSRYYTALDIILFSTMKCKCYGSWSFSYSTALDIIHFEDEVQSSALILIDNLLQDEVLGFVLILIDNLLQDEVLGSVMILIDNLLQEEVLGSVLILIDNLP